MTTIYNFSKRSDEELVNLITESIERDTDKRVDDIHIVSHEKEHIMANIVFSDKKVLLAKITAIEPKGNQIGIRIQGNYLN